MAKEPHIHHAIKRRLGYEEDADDLEVMKDWKERTQRVCKPCWELKYCPFGPLVEQSPLLPSLREPYEKHLEYLRHAVETGWLGEGPVEIDEERRELIASWLDDEEILEAQVLNEMAGEKIDEKIASSENPLEALMDSFSSDLPPIEEYRANYEVFDQSGFSVLPKDVRIIAEKRKEEHRKKLERILETGIEGSRKPLDEARKAYFLMQLESYDPDEYPEFIPPEFEEASCNIFGHICPVFFSAEAITETSTERRRGRYIPFKTKMRVVRRDNHTCQNCGAHLRDDEVEFDHIIPLSKGGSSEEHNIRLTCYDCNREKSDKIDI